MATCDNCDQIAQKFNIVKPLPGVPQGRFVVPLVRRNGQPGEMYEGEKIPACFLPEGLTVNEVLSAILTNTEFLGALKAALNNIN